MCVRGVIRVMRRLTFLQMFVLVACAFMFATMTTLLIVTMSQFGFRHALPSGMLRRDGLISALINSPPKPRVKLPHYNMPNLVPRDLPSLNMTLRLNHFNAQKLFVGRDFNRRPILIHARTNYRPPKSMYCDLSCSASASPKGPADALPGDFFNTMENPPELEDVSTLHRRGFRYVSTTSLESDSPSPYFSWHDFGFMEPLQNKTSEFDAIVMISNCHAENDRLAVVQRFQNLSIKVGTFGFCYRHQFRGDKVDMLRNVKFTFAFENSFGDDYVTEKYWQALTAGSVPVVYGSRFIEDFAPAPNSILHVQSIHDVERVAKQMKELLADESKYQQMLEWKRTGPSEKFIALIDLNAVHSTCRVCIKIADWHAINALERIRKQRELCVAGDRRRYFVRERGRVEFWSLSASESELESVESFYASITAHFESKNHRPIWVGHRQDLLNSTVHLRLYRVYPSFVTVREALYGNSSITSDAKLIEAFSHPAPAFDAIFV